MNRSGQTDPYRIDPSSIKSPPGTFRKKLKYLGPGFILSASVVGSGELISTTTLGAKAGFVTLWVILVRLEVKSLNGNVLNVRYKGKVISEETLSGENYTFTAGDFLIP